MAGWAVELVYCETRMSETERNFLELGMKWQSNVIGDGEVYL
jgi:hypothetical protein